MAGGRPRAFSTFTCPKFTCPKCKALYQVVKVEAWPETTGHEITCRGGLPVETHGIEYKIRNPGLRRADVTEITAVDPAALASSRGAAIGRSDRLGGEALSLSGVVGVAP